MATTAGATSVKRSVEAAFASGCALGPVRLADVAQQVLFAQQPGWQAFSLTPLTTIQVFARSRTGATNKARATKTPIAIFAVINDLIAQSAPSVEVERIKISSMLRFPMKLLPIVISLAVATTAIAVDPKDTMCVKQKNGTYKCRASGKIEKKPCCDTPSNDPKPRSKPRK